jgi:hypothetical protein
MGKTLALFALMLTVAIAFAVQTSTNFYPTGYDQRQLLITQTPYTAEIASMQGLFGTVRYISIDNSKGGEDLVCQFHNDGGAALESRALAAGQAYANRTMINTSSNFGPMNFTCYSQYLNGTTFPKSNVTSWWKLDEWYGNSTTDVYSLNTLETGAMNGGGGINSSWTSGKIYNATILNGGNQTLKINDSQSMNISKFHRWSFAMWILPTALSTNQTFYIFHKGSLGGNISSGGAVGGTNGTAALAVNNSGINWTIDTNFTFSTLACNNTEGIFNRSTWQHLIFSYNLSGATTGGVTNQTIYLNGVQLCSRQSTKNEVVNNSNSPWRFGDGYSLSNYSIALNWSAAYDDIIFANESINASQAAYIYNSSIKRINVQASLVTLR